MKKIHLILVLLFAFALLISTSGVASAISISPKYVGNTMVDLSWTQYESTNFSKYELGRNGDRIATITDRTTTFYRDTGVTKGNTYEYEIRVYGATGVLKETRRTRATTGEVHGTITQDTTWTAANSPYTLTGDLLRICDGARLTIADGVQVSSNNIPRYWSDISVREKGTLNADDSRFCNVSISVYDSHADIKNCFLGFASIRLDNSNDSVITNNTDCSSVIMSHSSNNTITGNTARRIQLVSSNNNSIMNNTVSNPWDHGIYLSRSSDNVITSNIVSNSSLYGIYLQFSSNNVVRGNEVSNNQYYGISLRSSSNNAITGNNVSDNRIRGISLSCSSDNNTITGNTVISNQYNGISLSFDPMWDSTANNSNNTLTNNTVSNNKGNGIYLYKSNNNTFATNTIRNNTKTGFYVKGSYNNTVTNNIVAENTLSGIYLYSSSYNTITQNNASGNGYNGIRTSSENNTVIDNSANGNDYHGIYLYYAHNSTISKNTVRDNQQNGIKVKGSTSNTLMSNKVNNSTDYGIFLNKSSNNTIYNNYFNNTNNSYDNGNNTWNITKTAGTNIVGGHYLGGNYWSDYNGTDLDGDKLGDTRLPYNCSGGIENGGDYHPLIREGVSGHKFNDINGDGVWGPIEPPLANWTIKLEGTAEDWSKVSLTTTTNENGSYKFEDVPRGDYTLSEIPEAGWIQTWPAHLGTYSVIIITNNDVKGKNFGNRRFWVSGHKFNDINGDGVWDPTEPPLANWTIKLEGTAEDESNVSLTTTTDENGSYKFEDVPKGNYTLSEVLMSGWNQTLPSAPGIYTVTITNADERNKDFGNHRFIGTRDYVIVGAPGERVGDNETQGRAYVFYGSTDMLHHTLSTPNPIAEANFGWSACTGDVGGDYLEEVIVGAPGEHVGENIAQGRAYVFYGSTDMLRHTLNISNAIANASFGWSVCTGDVNCDGFDEIIVGAPGERVRDNEAQGRAYVFYGSTGTLRHTLDTPNPISDASFGWSICTGDVNCDGFEEVIVGAPGERVGDNEAQGRAYAFYGSTGTLRYTMDTPSSQPEASFGWSVCTGDVNCDGFEEVIVGAPGERVGDNMAQGRIYVFNGSTGTLRYTMDTPNPQPEASFGWSVCTGDVNCDGFEEIIVGAPGERVGDNMAQGRAYVFYGSTGTLHHTMDTPNPQPEASFGWSVCTGDVNCNGFEEVIVGAPGERVGDNKAQGRAYVFYGSTGTLHHTMDTPNPQSDALFGRSVCTGATSPP